MITDCYLCFAKYLFVFMQINGIALDNKSLTECEALLRNCRDSLTLSLMKVSVNMKLQDLILFIQVARCSGFSNCAKKREEQVWSRLVWKFIKSQYWNGFVLIYLWLSSIDNYYTIEGCLPLYNMWNCLFLGPFLRKCCSLKNNCSTINVNLASLLSALKVLGSPVAEWTWKQNFQLAPWRGSPSRLG